MGPEAGRVRDREDRFIAAFNRGVEGLALQATPAWRAEREWAARIRACLAVLLERVEQDRALGRLVFVEALCAGPRVLALRALVLEQLAAAIDEGRAGHEFPHGLPPLAAEGAVGGAFWLIHSRLCDPEADGSLVELLDPLMAMIVLPYRGRAAAGRGARSARSSHLRVVCTLGERGDDRPSQPSRFAHPPGRGIRSLSGRTFVGRKESPDPAPVLSACRPAFLRARQ